MWVQEIRRDTRGLTERADVVVDEVRGSGIDDLAGEKLCLVSGNASDHSSIKSRHLPVCALCILDNRCWRLQGLGLVRAPHGPGASAARQEFKRTKTSSNLMAHPLMGSAYLNDADMRSVKTVKFGRPSIQCIDGLLSKAVVVLSDAEPPRGGQDARRFRGPGPSIELPGDH